MKILWNSTTKQFKCPSVHTIIFQLNFPRQVYIVQYNVNRKWWFLFSTTTMRRSLNQVSLKARLSCCARGVPACWISLCHMRARKLLNAEDSTMLSYRQCQVRTHVYVYISKYFICFCLMFILKHLMQSCILNIKLHARAFGSSMYLAVKIER